MALGDAPSWTARAEGLKRWVDGRAVNADPWRLFPPWLRECLPMPPGGGSPKAKYLELLNSFQSRPSLWVRAQNVGDHNVLWNELREGGLKPWVHRKVERAAKLAPEADVYHLPAFTRTAEIEFRILRRWPSHRLDLPIPTLAIAGGTPALEGRRQVASSRGVDGR